MTLLTVLFLQSRSTDRQRLDRLQVLLQAYELKDSQLSRDVLLARSGLLPNYDPLAMDRAGVLDAQRELSAMIQASGPAVRQALDYPLATLAATQQRKLSAVEQFKLNNALLRNSLLYFAYIGPTLHLSTRSQLLSERLGRLSYAVLSLLQSPDPGVEQELRELLSDLERASRTQVDLASLLTHGRLLLRVLPQVDQQLRLIQLAPVGDAVRALRMASMAHGAQVEARAQVYRYALYGSALLLVLSLAWLWNRLRARARDLRAAEHALQRQRLQLAESGKLALLGTHLAGVAHDLRTPMQSVSGSAEQMLRIWPDIEAVLENAAGADPAFSLAGIPWLQVREALAQIPQDLAAQSQALAGLAQHLLDFARPAGAGSQAFDVNGALTRTLRLVRHSIEKSVPHFQTDFAHDLPWVHGDPRELGQVVLNLINNAVEALEPGTGRVCVRTRADSPARVAIDIEDTGSGIAPEILERLFEPFFTTKQGRGGTGLGLGQGRAMIEAMGGTLRVASVPGRGTCVTLTLKTAPGSTGAAA